MNVQIASTPEGARLSVRVVFPSLGTLSTALGLFVATRLVILIIGYAGSILLPRNPSSRVYLTLSSWLVAQGGGFVGVWAHGDAFNNIIVAREGYWFDPLTNKGSPIVSPAFPSLVHVLGGSVIAGVVVSNVAFLLGLIILSHLLSSKKGLAHLTGQSSLFLSLLPYAFLLVAPYPWSLALLFTAIAFYCEEYNRPWFAALAAMFAMLTQPAAIAVTLALVIRRMASRSNGFTRQLSAAASTLLIPLGALGVMRYLQSQVDFSQREAIAVVLGVTQSPLTAWHQALSGQPSDHLLLGLNLALAVLALMTSPRVAKLLGIEYAAYVAGLLIWGLLVDPAEIGALLLLAFPVCVAAADYLVGEQSQTFALAASVFCLAILTALFVAWYPIGGSTGVIEASSANDVILTTFQSRFSRTHRNEAKPHELVLNLDNAVLFLADQPPAARYAPGADVTIPLYLYVLHPPQQGYLLSLRLTDASGKEWAKSDKVLWTTADSSLDETSTNKLVVGNYLEDTLSVKLDSHLPPGIYSLEVLAFKIPSFDRLSLTNAEGQSVGQIERGPVVIAAANDLGTTTTLVPSHPLRADATDGLSLLGYDVTARGAETTDVEVSLYWLARTPPRRDYTVFVQLLDNAGKVVAQSDSYPLGGHFPTSHLQPGEVLRDSHDLTMSADLASGKYRLIAGMYRLDTMQRLSFTQGGKGGALDHLELGTISPSAVR